MSTTASIDAGTRSGAVLNVSLVGAGFIGRVHAQCIAANAATRLAAVFDTDESAASALAARHGARVAGSLGEITGSGETDAVVIASSTDSHGEIARACARAGKPFLCEKPLDTHRDAAVETVRYVREAGVLAGIGFNRRFDRQYAALKRAVGEGEVGRVEMMHLTSRSHAPPTLDYVKKSGGQLRDKGSHFFDLACWIAGERPTEIHAAGACLIEPRFAEYSDVDTAMILLRMPSGALCHLNFSRRTAYGADERIEVSGSGGRVESRHPIPVDVALYQGEAIRQKGLHQHWYERIESTYPAQLAAFVEALEHPGREFPALIDGLVAESIADAGMRSLRTNRPEPIDYESERAARIPYSTVNGGARDISPFAFSRAAMRPKMPARKNFITTITRVANKSMCA